MAIAEPAAGENADAGIDATLADYGETRDATLALDAAPHCPVCAAALPFDDGRCAGDALWIEGQLLVDAKLRHVSRLVTVKT